MTAFVFGVFVGLGLVGLALAVVLCRVPGLARQLAPPAAQSEPRRVCVDPLCRESGHEHTGVRW